MVKVLTIPRSCSVILTTGADCLGLLRELRPDVMDVVVVREKEAGAKDDVTPALTSSPAHVFAPLLNHDRCPSSVLILSSFIHLALFFHIQCDSRCVHFVCAANKLFSDTETHRLFQRAAARADTICSHLAMSTKLPNPKS